MRAAALLALLLASVVLAGLGALTLQATILIGQQVAKNPIDLSIWFCLAVLTFWTYSLWNLGIYLTQWSWNLFLLDAYDWGFFEIRVANRWADDHIYRYIDAAIGALQEKSKSFHSPRSEEPLGQGLKTLEEVPVA